MSGLLVTSLYFPVSSWDLMTGFTLSFTSGGEHPGQKPANIPQGQPSPHPWGTSPTSRFKCSLAYPKLLFFRSGSYLALGGSFRIRILPAGSFQILMRILLYGSFRIRILPGGSLRIGIRINPSGSFQIWILLIRLFWIRILVREIFGKFHI